MNRLSLFTCVALAAIGLVALVGGCGQIDPGTVRSMGDVGYDSALDTAKQVFSQYYQIASVDADKGLITGRPKIEEKPSGRLLGGTAGVR